MVNLGADVVLRCGVSGSPTPTVKWSRRPLPLPEFDARFEISSSGEELKISSFGSSDLGTYTCRLRNSQGEAIHNIRVKVAGELSYLVF